VDFLPGPKKTLVVTHYFDHASSRGSHHGYSRIRGITHYLHSFLINSLGISALYHDGAAALIQDGRIVAAAQEERFTRKKHDATFPLQAVQYCLAEGNVSLAQVDYIVFYDKPFLKFERLLETCIAFAPKGFRFFAASMPLWLKEKLFQKRLIIAELKKIVPYLDLEDRLLFTEHHQSHAASAYYPSPFQEAVVLTMDGVGEWATTSVMIGKGSELTPLKEIHFPHSLGLLYSAFTHFIGFKVNSGEHKMMGLAPYGNPIYAQRIKDHLIDTRADGSFRLNMEYFGYCTGLTMINDKFSKLFGRKPRRSESPLTQTDMDLACSIQQVTEEVVLKLVRALRQETGITNLCLAGGVALNCVSNGHILREKIFDNVWVQPAAGDAGGALGAAMAAYYLNSGQDKLQLNGDSMNGSFLGPKWSPNQIQVELDQLGAIYERLSYEQMTQRVVDELKHEKVVGWFQGRMEFGPRALGARSILGDARSPKMQSVMNLKIKYRESFRPFAPAVLSESAQEYFDLPKASPYMTFVAPVLRSRRVSLQEKEKGRFGIDLLSVPRSDIPAVTHVDYSSRVQTVHRETNPLFHELLSEFQRQTGCGVLVNTSFNVRGEPIVCTPQDAYRCFMRTEMDILAIENMLLFKEKQPPLKDTQAWTKGLELN